MGRGAFLALALAAAWPASAKAFCGFYVGGADASLYNDATMVVLMRDGTKTVLSMQNDYQGPPEGFALVIPVPEVLAEENVRTLPKSIFERVDQLAAPRLVEYWEQDPCGQPLIGRLRGGSGGSMMAATATPRPRRDEATGVTVEAEFAVGEYDIVILGAEDSSGLETWLHRERYALPDGAGAALDPYVRSGTKFFVAKVDPSRVTFEDGRAVLSPLRVHYDAETFALPIRLGLLNARGKQDLLVHVLAKNARYDVANYPNVTIPTNLVVEERTAGRFGAFYRSVFDRVVEANPGAVVTEYSWQATNCDPCPTAPLHPGELALLGGDVIDGMTVPGRSVTARPQRPGRGSYGWTLTRLHHRYDADDVDHDLVFRRAGSIFGGRGMPNADGELREQVASGPGGVDLSGVQGIVRPSGGPNQFQGRYVILHRWEGRLTCDAPRRGRWGGPPGQPIPRPGVAPSALRAPRRGVGSANAMRLVRPADRQYLGAVSATPAVDAELDFAPNPTPVFVDHEEASEGGEAETEAGEPSEAEAEAGQAEPATPQPAPVAQPVAETGGCASCRAGDVRGGWAALALLALGLAGRRRQR